MTRLPNSVPKPRRKSKTPARVVARKARVRPSNPVAQAKRRARYRVKLAAYRKSECYKIVVARAGGRCEETWQVPQGGYTHKRGFFGPPYSTARCFVKRDWPMDTAPNRLTHHHKTYARFGGKELPEDIIVLCDRHNQEVESQHPTRKRNYRQSHIAERTA